MEKYFKLIEQKRQQAEMTITELCQKVGIQTMTYYNAKSGKSIIASDKFILLNKEVGIKAISII